MVWYEANRHLSAPQWKLALARIVKKWLNAADTKSGKRVFRKDKHRHQGLVVAVETTLADAAKIEVLETYEALCRSDVMLAGD